jgi:hypothetical protein
MEPITRQRLTKHESYVELLSRIVAQNYDYIFMNVPVYSPRKRLVGEVDLIGVKDGQVDIYEVKCSHRISKAKRQLEKIRNHLPKVRESFFFCGASRALICV